MPQKITYIVFGIDKAVAFEWIIDKISREKFHLEFILISGKKGSHFENYCTKKQVSFSHILYTSKKDIPRCIWQTTKLLRESRPDAVHAHLFEGGLIGITAAFLARIPKRIYTRHYATYHHQYHPQGVKYDRYINRLSTHIIAICNNVKEVLMHMENVQEKKIILIRHGFDLDDFYTVNEERIKSVAFKYNPLQKSPVIGVVSRYMFLKGIQYIIPAFKKILEKYPNALLILANAKGEDAAAIKLMLSELPAESYIEIDFENDNAALFKLFDIFIHVPVNRSVEAFGQIYVEALAAGIPSVFTLSGVAPEFIIDGENALIVPFENAKAIEEALFTILEDDALRTHIKQNAKLNLDNYFSLNLMINKLEQLYEQ